MGRLRSSLRWLIAVDINLTFDQKLQRWVNVAAAVGVVTTAITWGIGWITWGIGWTTNLPWSVALLIGLVAWIIALNGFIILGGRSRRNAPSGTPARSEPEGVNPQPVPPETHSRQAQEAEAVINLGDTANLFLTDGARFVPDDGSDRRTIFLPAFLGHWMGPRSSAVEAGRTFVARRTEFDKCDIYGPGVFVLAEGSVENTFHKCDWEEEWRAFWPATKRGRYVGVIALENCIFRRCNFKGVAFVVKPDEYRRLYRRFTGDDFNGP